jgi:hypothetical protein
MIRPTYLAIRSLTASEELTSDIWVLSYSVLRAAICEGDVDLMLIFGDKNELADGRLRSEGSGAIGRGGGPRLVATLMFTLSSKSRKEVSVDRVATISGTSELAVWRMNNTMTLKIYLIQESSRGGGSSHEYVAGILVSGWEEVEDRSPTVCSEESDKDECRDQRDAIVRESNFKMKSCD